MVAEFAQDHQMGFGALMTAASVALRVGEMETAIQIMSRRVAGALAASSIRMDLDLMPLADEPPFAPRRMDETLVWPLEAPMIDAARFRMFRDMKVESGLPER